MFGCFATPSVAHGFDGCGVGHHGVKRKRLLPRYTVKLIAAKTTLASYLMCSSIRARITEFADMITPYL
jgi:hypothetical protein